LESVGVNPADIHVPSIKSSKHEEQTRRVAQLLDDPPVTTTLGVGLHG
jgi:hypothetical protein